MASFALPNFLLRLALQADGAWFSVTMHPSTFGVARLRETVWALPARVELLRVDVDGVLHVVVIVK